VLKELTTTDRRYLRAVNGKLKTRLKINAGSEMSMYLQLLFRLVQLESDLEEYLDEEDLDEIKRIFREYQTKEIQKEYAYEILLQAQEQQIF